MFFLFKRDDEPEVPPVMRVSGRSLQRSQEPVGFWGRLWQKLPFSDDDGQPVIMAEGESSEEKWQKFWELLDNFFYRLRSWIPLILLVLAAYLSYGWLQTLEKQAIEKAMKKIVEHLPDTTMSSFVSTSMNAEGKIARQVSALSMKHYPSDETFLTHPYIVLYDKSQPQWYIWAEKGKISEDEKTYFLLGKTYFKRYNDEGDLQLDIMSKDVTYSPDTGFASTEEKTTISSPQGVTHAVGMQVWINERRMKLKQKVRGRYVFKQEN